MTEGQAAFDSHDVLEVTPAALDDVAGPNGAGISESENPGEATDDNFHGIGRLVTQLSIRPA
jgi:hypothetical protein